MHSVFSTTPTSTTQGHFDLRLKRFIGLTAAAFVFISLVLVSAVAQDSSPFYQQTNLVSDVPGLAQFTDSSLVNPWGLISTGSSPWWVADNGTGLSTLYNGAGAKQTLVVTVASTTSDPSTPTGVVANSTTDFKLTAASNSNARFIFVTEDGTISGWAPSVNATNSVIKVNRSGSAVYKGVTIGQAGGANFLYAANFFTGSVDVFNASYAPVNLPAGAFTDPNLPDGFAPFNVQNIGGNIFVAFAKQDAEHKDEVAGPKLGYVDKFDTSGNLLMRFDHVPFLNAPWGLALAPTATPTSPGFGKASGLLLVGMFGSGQIASFDPATGEFEGLLRGLRGRPIQIDGLWALRFGNGSAAGPMTTLFFTAGIDDEQHGLFGTITPIPGRGHGGDDEDDNDRPRPR